MTFPTPPKLKTTIIQLNKDVDPEDNNYEVLCNDYVNGRTDNVSFSTTSTSDEQQKKKRRRSSSTIGDEELAKRRTETKQLHSMIEKRRRIKINREFEALKYLIPACRTADSGIRKPVAAVNNANKIDGMYKLTILKTSVEYILYLHHIIQKQHDLLSSSNTEYSFDDSFTKVPLDVNQYRNIDQEFDFHELTSKVTAQNSNANRRSAPETASSTSCTSSIAEIEEGPESGTEGPQITKFQVSEHIQKQLPTPHVTPQISPILSMLGKYKNDVKLAQSGLSVSTSASDIQARSEMHRVFESQTQNSGPTNKSFSFASSKRHTTSTSGSASTSPFTIPIKSSVRKSDFQLPDPALVAADARFECDSISPIYEAPGSSKHALPRKMCFRSEVPPQNLIANVGFDGNDIEVDRLENDRLENASKTLLALRKPSIERLLN